MAGDGGATSIATWGRRPWPATRQAGTIDVVPRVFRARRSQWVITAAFAVPLLVLAVVTATSIPELGIPLAVVVLACLAWEAAATRRAGGRPTASASVRPRNEMLEEFRAIRFEPGRMPEGHGPGDPEGTLVVDHPIDPLGQVVAADADDAPGR